MALVSYWDYMNFPIDALTSGQIQSITLTFHDGALGSILNPYLEHFGDVVERHLWTKNPQSYFYF